MSVDVLGISGFYHDSAAALLQDGRIVAAAQEERFTRKKHDPGFPREAVNYCLGEGFIEASDLDAVVFYDNPLLTVDRALKSLLTVAPRGQEQWRVAAPSLLGEKLFVSDLIQKAVGAPVRVLFAEHHLSHAASAFYPSPFEKAAILTMDGVGEWATTTIGVGDEQGVRLVNQVDYPHSLGLLYSAFTYYCGFKVNSGEYKLMGLAPYGTPRFADLIKDKLIDLRADGSFRLDTQYFGYLDGNVMTNERFHELFGGPARVPESRLTRREMDLAASVQKVIEEAVLALARHAREVTGLPNLVMAGGVALNCVANGHLLRSKIFDNLWIQPAAGDAGGALGAALLGSHQELGVPRDFDPARQDGQHGSYLGPSFTSTEIRAYLDRHECPYEQVEDQTERSKVVARTLADGGVVGLFSGRMEFGPRSLGARSILGDPRDPETQVNMNVKIKYRESFRPFAPAVTAEACSDYFEMEGDSPYMLLVADVHAKRRKDVAIKPHEDEEDMLQIVRQARSDIPAVTHVDGSARVQTVSAESHPQFHGVIEAFHEITGCPVVVNTSFNVRSEPIVCSPEEAYRCFMRTGMDMLVLEDCVLHKKEQPPSPEDDDWRKNYELD